MEKSTKWTLIGLCATCVCFVVALVCAILRKFDLISSIMFGIVAAFSAAIVAYMVYDFVAQKKAEGDTKNSENK